MSASRSKHVRLFRSAASARLADADTLRAGGRPLGAIYLAGYAVECSLKALVLSLVTEHKQPAMIAKFRGTRAHDYGWLLTQYHKRGGAPYPKPVAAAFLVVGGWGTELRYDPRIEYDGDVGAFFDALETILTWANGRL